MIFHSEQDLEFDYVGIIISDDVRCESDHIVSDYTKRVSTDNSLKGIKKIAEEQRE